MFKIIFYNLRATIEALKKQFTHFVSRKKEFTTLKEAFDEADKLPDLQGYTAAQKKKYDLFSFVQDHSPLGVFFCPEPLDFFGAVIVKARYHQKSPKSMIVVIFPRVLP